MFVLNYWLREFLLSAFVNRFELRCETKQLMLLYYKMCPCYIYNFSDDRGLLLFVKQIRNISSNNIFSLKTLSAKVHLTTRTDFVRQ